MTLCATLTKIFHAPLNKHIRIRCVLTFILWQFMSRLIPRDYVFNWIADSRLYVQNGETSITGNLYYGLMEFEDMSFVLHFLRETDLFADVGANSGSYTILASKVVGAHVVSFEPVPSTSIRLVRNLELNEVTDRVSVRNMALGSSEGFLEFSTHLDSMNHVLRIGESDELAISVRRSTLDAELSRVPLLIKIDVEGFESEVLEGGLATLQDDNLKVVIIELNGSGLSYGNSDEEIAQKLLQLGFTPISYEPESRVLTELGISHNVVGNTIFVRDFYFVKNRIETAISRAINRVQI
jgi:FkbM family methyltransferase